MQTSDEQNKDQYLVDLQHQFMDGTISYNKYTELVASTDSDYVRPPVIDLSSSIEEVEEELSLMVKGFANAIERAWSVEGVDFLDVVTREMRLLGYEARNRCYDRRKGITQRSSDVRTNLKNSLKRFVFERDEYRCVKCGTHVNLSIDHIHPVSKGGSDDESNLQTLCRSCNSSKGASLGS
jgi:5-methylcytosine-specific restriction endonuclease McrA